MKLATSTTALHLPTQPGQPSSPATSCLCATNSRTCECEPTDISCRYLMLVRGHLPPVRVRTYRYLLPLTRAARKSVLIPALPYPKERLGVIEDPEYTPPHSQVARAAAVAEAMGDSETARELIEWIL